MKNNKKTVDLSLEIMFHPTYYKVLQQIVLGRKTSTSISKELKMSQSGIYERLKILKEKQFVINDEKNFKLNTDAFVSGIYDSLPKSFRPSVDKKLIEKMFLKELTNDNSNLVDAVAKSKKTISDLISVIIKNL